MSRRKQLNGKYAKLLLFSIFTGVCLAGVVVLLGVSMRDSRTVAIINGLPVEPREFMAVLSQQRSAVFRYYKEHYKAEFNDRFWSTKYSGSTPAEYAKQKALEQLTRNKVKQQLAMANGIETPRSYTAFLKQLAEENKRRHKAVTHGQAVFGPVEYDEDGYYDYLQSNLFLRLKDKLMQKELAFTDDDVAAAYEQEKEEHFRNKDDLTVSLITFVADAGGDQAEDALNRLRQGEPFDQVVRLYNAPVVQGVEQELNLKPTSDEQENSDINNWMWLLANRLNVGESVEEQSAKGMIFVIQLISRKTNGYRPLDEVREQLRSELAERKLQEMVVPLIAQAQIKLNRSLYDAIKIQ